MDYNKWVSMNRTSLKFYDNKLPYKEKQFNHPFQLRDYFSPMIGNRSIVAIADLGAGLFATTGSTWPSAVINLYPSDIMADEYKKLLDKHRVTPLIPVEKQDMTKLTYADEMFDIVHCVNALDHCFDPLSALHEMYRVCRIGGWIYLRHFANNGIYHNYSGAHHWNINVDSKNRLTISDRDEKGYIVEEYTNSVEMNGTIPEIEIVSKMRKQYV